MACLHRHLSCQGHVQSPLFTSSGSSFRGRMAHAHGRQDSTCQHTHSYSRHSSSTLSMSVQQCRGNKIAEVDLQLRCTLTPSRDHTVSAHPFHCILFFFVLVALFDVLWAPKGLHHRTGSLTHPTMHKAKHISDMLELSTSSL